MKNCKRRRIIHHNISHPFHQHLPILCLIITHKPTKSNTRKNIRRTHRTLQPPSPSPSPSHLPLPPLLFPPPTNTQLRPLPFLFCRQPTAPPLLQRTRRSTNILSIFFLFLFFLSKTLSFPQSKNTIRFTQNLQQSKIFRQTRHPPHPHLRHLPTSRTKKLTRSNSFFSFHKNCCEAGNTKRMTTREEMGGAAFRDGLHADGARVCGDEGRGGGRGGRGGRGEVRELVHVFFFFFFFFFLKEGVRVSGKKKKKNFAGGKRVDKTENKK